MKNCYVIFITNVNEVVISSNEFYVCSVFFFSNCFHFRFPYEIELLHQKQFDEIAICKYYE